METFIKLCIAYFILISMGVILSCIQKKIFSQLQVNTVGKITADILAHLHKVQYKLIMDKDFASLTQKINNDAVNIMSFILSNVGSIILYFVTLPIIFFILCRISVFLSFLLLVNGLLYILIYKKSKTKLYHKERENKEAQADYFSQMYSQLQNIKFIKEHSLYNFFEMRLSKGFESLYTSTQNLVDYKNIINILQGILNTVILISCYICVGAEIIQGTLQAGLFVLIASYISMSKTAIIYFGNLGQSYQSQKVSYLRLAELIEFPEDKIGTTKLTQIENITIENLTFSYKDDTILNNFSATFSKGKIYGIKGENGAGKSTLMDILLGLYNDYEGRVLFNERDIKNLNMDFIRKSIIGISEQFPVVISDTLLSNLELEDNYNKDSIMKYIDLLNMHYLIGHHKALEIKIGAHGTDLSGGEKQKVGIIRQLLKNPSVLIFDEPTSALDSESCQQFIELVNAIKNDKIIIIVSHEENILSKCDVIIPLTRRNKV